MRLANRELLTSGIDRNRLRSRQEWDDITRLTGPRARRLREFMDRGADLGLMELRPVWLMNPDVASRVLPLKSGLFDTVIYDEASQVPVEYALPSAFRSKSMIVSGDEKQMPPTAFFTSRVENDEADMFEPDEFEEGLTEQAREEASDTWNRREIKDCPDLLQLAKSVLPTATLQIHYRSAYRELISFSNASFYGNHLSVPVRHPDAEVQRVRPLEVIRADGVYEDQTNPREAEKVVDYLASLWSDSTKAPKTVGVVTFNRKQADLIEAVLEVRAENDARFRDALARERERTEQGEDMSFFVKNVENVQGDERDIIIFSSTFGRNSQGTFRRSFGVLGQTGGERRLNVAVTRAREKVVLVTSMPIAEISDLLATQRPPVSPRDYLQAYFEYARALSAGELDGGRALLSRVISSRTQQERGSRVEKPEMDGFQMAVSEFIHQLGWQTTPVPDTGAFSLDFAIEDPRTGHYGIGIECDAPRHRLLQSARARELWRPSVLKRSIPHVHRVSSRGWYHNRSAEQQRLRDAIEGALG
jgi:primosomal replication protein N''